MSDGILSNGVTGGAAYNYLDFDAIEDLNVVTLGASSEYQQAQGGVMNMVTKAGNNTFRADGMHYWAPSSLVSSPIKLPCNCPLGETGFKQYKYVDFGYHAGGPIWKDHVWYFGGVSNAGPSYRNPGQADAAEEYQWVRDEYRSNHKFTWKASSKSTSVRSCTTNGGTGRTRTSRPLPGRSRPCRGTRATSSPARRR
jgi:hypothetical protein